MNRKHFISLIAIFLTITWIFFSLFFKVNYWQNHDGDFHLMRAYAAIDSFHQGNLPLRWSQLFNYGCGLPLFNFYYPLLYYIFIFLSSFTFNLIFSFKLIFLFSLALGAFSMYFLLFYLLKSRSASLIGALCYLLNPYFLQLIYVRANPEILTYGLIPIILLCLVKSNYFFLFISLIAYFLSHNTTVLITLPFLITVFCYSFFKNRKDYFLVVTLVLATLASSFFLGPAILEKKYVKLGHQIAADFSQHYPSLKQLFISPWGWGYSTSDLNDGMSFKFGYAQWFILFIAILFLFKNQRLLFLVVPILFILFLCLSPSKFIWDIITPLQQLQYPWRLLGLASLLISFLAPLVYQQFSFPLKNIFLFITLILLFLGNRHHLTALPKTTLPDFTRIGSTTIADEILPANASGDCYHDSHRLSYFPDAYRITQGQKIITYRDCSGYLCYDSDLISPLDYSWHYQSTPIEKLFNILSLLAASLWLIIAFFKARQPL